MPNETKICQNCKTSFEIAPEDFKFYEKIDVPPPTWCPECRAKRRLVWRGQRVLHKTKSAATGKEIFSMFHPSVPYKIYENDYWASDAWDPMEYGKEIDWSRPFLEQLQELNLTVPKAARSVDGLDVSDYCNHATNLKNCYLVFASSNSENCRYCTWIHESKDCIDCVQIFSCEICYGCAGCRKCYECFYSLDCTNCVNVTLCKNLFNCEHCFGCANLRSKKYCIFNKQYSKEEYEERLQNLRLNSHVQMQELRKQAKVIWETHPIRFTHSARSENVTGEYIFDSADIKDGYLINGAEHCRYCQSFIPPVKDCYDYSIWGQGAELVYEAVQSGNGIARIIACFDCFPNCVDLSYCLHCRSSRSLFGCVGLRNKKFCIFNKQYSEDEYFTLVEKIKKHMNKLPHMDTLRRAYTYGEFFPASFSPYSYNEGLTHELFPLSKEEIEQQGFIWRSSDSRAYSVTCSAANLPDVIGDAGDSILKEMIECEHCGKCDDDCITAFRILPQDLIFYKKYNISLPRLCHNCRYFQWMEGVNRSQLYKRTCACAGAQSENGIYKNTVAHSHGEGHCSHEFETAYDPDRKEIVYCEECYKAEVI